MPEIIMGSLRSINIAHGTLMRDLVFSLHHYYIIIGDKSGSSLGTDSFLNQIEYTIRLT